MIIILSGPDSYRRLQKVKEIKQAYQAKNPRGAVLAIDAEEASQRQEFARSVGAAQLFAPVRLIHISNYTSGATDKVFTTAITAMVDKKTDVVVLDDEGTVPKAWKFLKDEKIKHQEFEYLEGALWVQYINTQAKNKNLELTKDGLGYLDRHAAKNTWKLMSDLEMLALAQENPVTAHVCARILGDKQKKEFFPLVLGFQSPNRSQKIKSLEQLLADGTDGAKIFNTAAALAKTKASQYARLDVLVKSGLLDYEEALVDLAIA